MRLGQVALAICDEPLGPVRRQQVAVLFVDIVGFTRMAEAMPPEAVVAMLNPDAQSMSTLLAQFQGRIGSPLPFDQSLIQAWPQIVSLIAGTILFGGVWFVAMILAGIDVKRLGAVIGGVLEIGRASCRERV